MNEAFRVSQNNMQLIQQEYEDDEEEEKKDQVNALPARAE